MRMLSIPLFVLVLSLAAGVPAAEPAPPPAGEKAPPPPADPVAVVTTSMGEIHVRLFAAETPKTVANFLELAEGVKEFTDVKTGEKVKRPFYDGLIFHRVIKDFMIQGGCPRGNGTGDPGYRFEDEINGKALGLDKLKALDEGRPHPYLGIRSQADFQRTIVAPLLHKMGIDSQEKLDARRAEVDGKIRSMTVLDVYVNQGYVYDESRPSHEPKRGSLAMANSGPATNGSQFFINLADTPWLTGKHTVFGEVVKGMEVVDAIGNVKTTESENRPLTEVKITSIRRQPSAD